ncbi:helix-turn-helix domain-containing protein [Cryobacterium sp. Hh38]|uniref:helix-turn-helix domain-containing protein n=1 Tax=Cryobacterium sp. Hh38 TaxID=1259156 RepID=UPI001069264E|nr:helix-turn-helix domain-containing protein [Cryobacterium sp. Hh38]TFD56399.1 helix-turn-helix domain-containing protein [Cryobacterium sp. Hh38]
MAENAKAREGFGMIPNWVVRETEISAYALLVYVALVGRTDKTNVCWPSQKTLAIEARCSVPQVKRALKELQTVGIVTWTAQWSGKQQLSNRYTVHSARNPAICKGGDLTELGGGSDRATPGVCESYKEDPCEEDPDKEDEVLKVTASDDRALSFIHRDDKFATPDQVAYMEDCYKLVHLESPDEDEISQWQKSSSLAIHEGIRSYWSEIEHGDDDHLNDVIDTGVYLTLSAKGRSYINNRLNLESSPYVRPAKSA